MNMPDDLPCSDSLCRLVRLMIEAKKEPMSIDDALEEFLGLLPPNIMIDGEDSIDRVAILTFDPPRPLSVLRGKEGQIGNAFRNAQKELTDEIKSIIVDELGYRRIPRTNATFTRAGINVSVLDNTHSRDMKRSADSNVGIPSCSVEFYRSM